MSFVPGRRTVFIVLLTALLCGSGAMADTVTVTPTKDNSLYQNFGGNESNGAGTGLFAGVSSCCGPRRALMAFDVAGNVPPGATITGVSLTLDLEQAAPGSLTQPVSLHRLVADWGEGTSISGGPGGFGGAPTAGDATWAHTFFATDFWTTPGGDFAAAASATTSVDEVLGPYAWSSAALIADVQAWLDAPAVNFGWILLGDETGFQNARKYSSREGSTPPSLQIDYELPAVCGDGTLAGDEECDDGNNIDGDGCQGNCLNPVCGDGIQDPGEQCDDGNDIDGDGCNSCIDPSLPVPTVGEWGLFIMTLLLLSVGTLVFGRRETVTSGPLSVGMSLGQDRPMLIPSLFAKTMLVTLGLVLLGLGLAMAVTGGLTAVDTLGALLSVPFAAYLVHLWIDRKE